MIVDDLHYNDEQNQAIKEASQDCILLLILLNMRHFPAKPIHFVKNPSFIHMLIHRIAMNVESQSPCAVEACIFVHQGNTLSSYLKSLWRLIPIV